MSRSLSHIFAPYAHAQDGDNHTGSGIGLVAMRELVMAHAGEVLARRADIGRGLGGRLLLQPVFGFHRPDFSGVAAQEIVEGVEHRRVADAR